MVFARTSITERGLPMNNITTELINTLVAGKDVSEFFRSHLEVAMNELLKAELTAFLDYEKYERHGWHTGNSRNGNYSRCFETEYGKLNLVIPRDRNGDFQNQLLTPYSRREDSLESMIIHLFEKGITTREISDLIEKMYGHHYSPSTISNITMAAEQLVEAFNNRRLAERYVCVFLDATVIPVRRATVENEALHIAVGIREDGTKEVISYTMAPTESASVWEDVLEDIKARGAQDVLLFITDDLSGLRSKILEHYPQSSYQSCLVHASRNIIKKVRPSDKKEIAEDFKQIYRQKNIDQGREALEAFILKWQKKYPRAVKPLIDNDYLITFYKFPECIKRTIYSTNLIEGMNKQIKRYTKRKEQFPNEDSLERFVVSWFNNYNQKFLDRSHIGFKQASQKIAKMFDDLRK